MGNMERSGQRRWELETGMQGDGDGQRVEKEGNTWESRR